MIFDLEGVSREITDSTWIRGGDARLDKIRVLVVDDHPVVRTGIKKSSGT